MTKFHIIIGLFFHNFDVFRSDLMVWPMQHNRNLITWSHCYWYTLLLLHTVQSIEIGNLLEFNRLLIETTRCYIVLFAVFQFCSFQPVLRRSYGRRRLDSVRISTFLWFWVWIRIWPWFWIQKCGAYFGKRFNIGFQ